MMRLGLAAALAVLIGDQLSKWAVLDFFADRPRAVSLTSFFDLILTFNHGVSFGLFNNGERANALIFSALAAVIVAALLYWLYRVTTPLLAVAIGCVVGGAVGNVVDRLARGAVVDFLDFHIGAWHWPAFNVADSAICIGVGLMLLDSFFGTGRSEVRNPAPRRPARS